MYFKNEEEYKNYLKENEIESKEHAIEKFSNNFFNWTEEGEILLDRQAYQKSFKNIEEYSSCVGWILLNDGKTMALLKHPFGDIYRDLSLDDYYIALYNNILMPQIAKQLQNEAASYYLAKKDKNDKRKYVLTLDFKEKNQELVEGNTIFERSGYPKDIIRIDKILEILEDYLIEKGFYATDIERVKKDFVKQSFFNKFIKQLDEHNGNWSILENNKDHLVKMAPAYDLDCSVDIAKKRKIQRVCQDGGFSLASFIKNFGKEAWFKQYIRRSNRKF